MTTESPPVLLVVADTETTGLDEKVHDVVQLASLFVGEDIPLITFNKLANPGHPIPEETTAVHGISDEAVLGQPRSKEVVRAWWNDIVKWSKQMRSPPVVILAGHNLQFDLRMLNKHLPPSHLVKNTAGVLDTVLLCRRSFPDAQNHTLEYIYGTHCGLSSANVVNAHDALSDVWMVFELLQLLSEKHGMDAYQMLEWVSEPVRLQTMPYGKYKDSVIDDVPTDYMEYMLRQGGLDVDVQFTFEREVETRPRRLIEVMPFGKYKDSPMENIPRRYAQWMVENMDSLSRDMLYSLEHYFPGVT